MKLLVLLFAALPLAAQSVASPQAAVMIDRQGRLMAVAGVLGTLLPGERPPLPADVEAQTVLSAAFAGSTFLGSNGAVKTDSSLLIISPGGVVQSRFSTPPGPVFFSFAADGSLTWVYYTQTGVLANPAANAALNTSSWDGVVVALGPAGSSIHGLVRVGQQLWDVEIDTGNGSVLSQTPVPGNPPAVWFQGGWLVTTSSGLSAGTGAVERDIPVPEPVTSLQVAGPNTVAVNSRWLLNARGQLLEVPVRRRMRPGGIR